MLVFLSSSVLVGSLNYSLTGMLFFLATFIRASTSSKAFPTFSFMVWHVGRFSVGFLAIFVFVPWLYFRRYGGVEYLRARIKVSRFFYGKDSYPVAFTTYQLAKFHNLQGDLDDAFECYQRSAALLIQSRRGDSLTQAGAVARFLTRIGQDLCALRRYPEGLEVLETALSIQKELGRQCFVMHLQQTLNCIGETHEKMGNVEDALRTYQVGLENMRERADAQCMDMAISLVRVGSVYETMGDQYRDEALERYQEAMSIYLFNTGEFPCRKSIAELYAKIGNLQSDKGEVVAAVESFRLAVDVYRRLGKTDEDEVVKHLLSRASDLDHLSSNNV